MYIFKFQLLFIIYYFLFISNLQRILYKVAYFLNILLSTPFNKLSGTANNKLSASAVWILRASTPGALKFGN